MQTRTIDFLPAPREGDPQPHGQGFLVHRRPPRVAPGLPSPPQASRPASAAVDPRLGRSSRPLVWWSQAGSTLSRRPDSAGRSAFLPGLKAGASCKGIGDSRAIEPRPTRARPSAGDAPWRGASPASLRAGAGSPRPAAARPGGYAVDAEPSLLTARESSGTPPNSVPRRQGVPNLGSTSRSSPYQPALRQARISRPETRIIAGFSPEDPANTNEKFKIDPRNAMIPTNRPRIRQIPMTTSPNATAGPRTVWPLSRTHSRKLTYHEYATSGC